MGGFAPLSPDWLVRSNATYTGTKEVEGRTCYTWAGGPPGDWFMMVSDDWSVDENNHPCFYEDHFKTFARVIFGMRHTLTFHADTYSEAIESDDVFSPPAGVSCAESCP